MANNLGMPETQENASEYLKKLREIKNV